MGNSGEPHTHYACGRIFTTAMFGPSAIYKGVVLRRVARLLPVSHVVKLVGATPSMATLYDIRLEARLAMMNEGRSRRPFGYRWSAYLQDSGEIQELYVVPVASVYVVKGLKQVVKRYEMLVVL